MIGSFSGKFWSFQALARFVGKQLQRLNSTDFSDELLMSFSKNVKIHPRNILYAFSKRSVCFNIIVPALRK